MTYEAKLIILFIVVLNDQSVIYLPEDRVDKSRIYMENRFQKRKLSATRLQPISCSVIIYFYYILVFKTNLRSFETLPTITPNYNSDTITNEWVTEF